MAQNSQAFPYQEDTYIAELPSNISLMPQAGLHLHRKGVLEWRQQHHLANDAYHRFKIAYKNSIEDAVSEDFKMRSN